MAKQAQPMRKGSGRQPGAALSAALSGRAAPGLASAVKQGQVAAGAKLADAIKASPGASVSPGAAASTSLASAVKPDPAAQRTYTTTGQTNQNAGNVREGMAFQTFTKADRPGVVYHEYKDPKTGERHVYGVKAGKNSLGG